MKVRYHNKQGQYWEFASVKEANRHLKKGWREHAEIVQRESGKILEINEQEES